MTTEGQTAGPLFLILKKRCFPPPSWKVNLGRVGGRVEAGSCYFPAQGSGLGWGQIGESHLPQHLRGYALQDPAVKRNPIFMQCLKNPSTKIYDEQTPAILNTDRISVYD